MVKVRCTLQKYDPDHYRSSKRETRHGYIDVTELKEESYRNIELELEGTGFRFSADRSPVEEHPGWWRYHLTKDVADGEIYFLYVEATKMEKGYDIRCPMMSTDVQRW